MGKGLVAAVMFGTALAAFAGRASDWPQLQRDAAHTGYTPDEPKPPFKVKWSEDLGEPLYPGHHLVVAEGKVFVGTGRGNLYALDRKGGERLWCYKTGAPILGSAAYEGGMVYVNGADRFCHAVSAGTGSPAWKFETDEPLWAAPVVADGKVFIGGRDGYVYAVDAKSGRLVWKKEIGGIVMATPAYADGVLYVPGGDMHVYAYGGGDGGLLWKSVKIPGAAIRDTWLVVSHGAVIATTQYAQANLDGGAVQREVINPWIEKHKDDTVLVEDDVFPEIRKWLAARPDQRAVHVLDAETGREKMVAPILPVFGGGCTPAPPAVDPEGWAYTVYANVQIGASGCAFLGRLDLKSGRFDPLLKDLFTGPAKFKGRPGHQPKTGKWPRPWQEGTFHGCFPVTDHSWAVSVGGKTVFPLRDVSGRVSRDYFDLRTGKDRRLIAPRQKDRGVPLKPGSSRLYNHSFAVPMAISGKMVFHKTIIGAVDAYEGN